MAKRSKRINLADKNKEQHINPETLKFFQKYQIDMSIRDLSEKTIRGYNSDLMQWFIYMYNNQFNLSVLEAKEEDLEEYYFWRKQQGNNVNRQKRVMSSISAFYKFLRKKKLITESPMEFIDRPKQGQPVVVQTYLKKEEVQFMREKLSEYGDVQLQVYAFLSLTTMARVNAIAHLKWDQINMEERICSDVLEKEGKIVEYTAKEGYEVLKELVETDEGSHYLGEVALVDHFSPISQSNQIFYETLFDENASCHLAIGASYPTCLKNSDGLSDDELKERGLNHSLTHVDFMIGHEHMNIKGYTRDGQEVDIMIDGRLQV